MPFDLEKLSSQLILSENSDEFRIRVFNYAKILKDQDLPVLFSTKHLALELDYDYSKLQSILSNPFENYTYFKLKKRNSISKEDYREIMAPTPELKHIQRWIHFNILQQRALSIACVGFRKGLSILDNAKPHANAKEVLKIDLLRFFDTITDRRIFGFFVSLGYHKNVALDLAMLTTAVHRDSYWDSVEKKGYIELSNFYERKPPVLPQGAPTSPMLANYIASKMDVRLSALAAKTGANYSRYADDLTFSINRTDAKLPSKELLFSIIKDEGFFINKEKVKYFKAGIKQYVTGLTVTNDIHIAKTKRKEIFKHLYYAKKYGPLDHIKRWSANEKIAPPYNFQDWLLGNISFIYSIDKVNGIKMLEEYKKINWTF